MVSIRFKMKQKNNGNKYRSDRLLKMFILGAILLDI